MYNKKFAYRISVIWLSILLTGCTLENSNNIIDVVNSNYDNSNISIDTNDETTNNTNSTGSINTNTEYNNSTDNEVTEVLDDGVLFEGYKLIEVDGGELSGHREPNVVVNVGFGENRFYYSFTNDFGQVTKVITKEIILQNESTEPVLSTGRYYPDEAKVPGTESSTLDEGHVIADSLGGVANAYNITPQNSTLNRHGDQAYMEQVIRAAGGCTDFIAIITYPNTETQIPSHYSYTYTINGTVINDEFDNINPDEANEEINNSYETNNNEIDVSTVPSIKISSLDKKLEVVELTNVSDVDIDLKGCTLVSVKGNQRYVFQSYILSPGSSVKIGDSEKNTDIDLHWLIGRGVWNNSDSDPAELYNNENVLIDSIDD